MGHGPCIRACKYIRYGKTKLACQLLCNYKAMFKKDNQYNITYRGILYENTPIKNVILNEAIIHKNLKVLQLILDFGADPNFKNSTTYNISTENISTDNTSAPVLLLAAKHEWKEGVITLLEYKADVNILSDYGETALHWASYKGHVGITKLLLAKNANMEIADSYKSTPLMDTVYYDNIDVARILVEYGCCINYHLPNRIWSVFNRQETICYLNDRKQVINDHNVGVNKRNALYLKTLMRVLKYIMPKIMGCSDLVNYILSFGYERILSE